MASVLLILFLFGQTQAGVIDCANTVDCRNTVTDCMSGEPCSIYCNGTGLTTKICLNAIFNCPQNFRCTFVCDNDGWAGGDGTHAGKICQNVVINGATNGDLYVNARTERNFSFATNKPMDSGTINCGASSTCSVSCAGAQVCEDVTINGADTTEIYFEALILPTVRDGYPHFGAFTRGTINCGSNADCNINCLGEETCPATQFNGGDNGNLNFEATGEDALIEVLVQTNIVCPDNADCNIVCQCTDVVCERTCANIFIDGTLSNTLTIDAHGDFVLKGTHISCPTDSLADECVITISEASNGHELTNAIIVADSNSFLGFTLDCSEAIPCWTTDGTGILNAPIVVCDVDSALKCTMQQVNDEWDVFRCRDEGDDCDVSLSPTMATTEPTQTPFNDPTQSPFNDPTQSPFNPEDSYSSESDSLSEDSSSSDESGVNAAFGNNDQYLNDMVYMSHDRKNNEEMNVSINLSKSSLINLWAIFILLLVTIGISLICFNHYKR